MASIERTAYPRFKRFLSARELHVFYTPQPEEIAWAREQARSDGHLLALMVQLKCFNRMGHFPGLDDVPDVVVAHIRRDLGLGDSDSQKRSILRIDPSAGQHGGSGPDLFSELVLTQPRRSRVLRNVYANLTGMTNAADVEVRGALHGCPQSSAHRFGSVRLLVDGGHRSLACLRVM